MKKLLTLSTAAIVAACSSAPALAACGLTNDEISTDSFVGTQGVWYDRGDYLFMYAVDHEPGGNNDSVVTHYRMDKAACEVTFMEIEHAEPTPLPGTLYFRVGDADQTLRIVERVNAKGHDVTSRIRNESKRVVHNHTNGNKRIVKLIDGEWVLKRRVVGGAASMEQARNPNPNKWEIAG